MKRFRAWHVLYAAGGAAFSYLYGPAVAKALYPADPLLPRSPLGAVGTFVVALWLAPYAFNGLDNDEGQADTAPPSEGNDRKEMNR